MSSPSPELKRTDKLSSEGDRFGFHSRHKRIELQFVGACQTKLLYARQKRAKRFRKPAIDKGAGFSADRDLRFDRGPWKPSIKEQVCQVQTQIHADTAASERFRNEDVHPFEN